MGWFARFASRPVVRPVLWSDDGRWEVDGRPEDEFLDEWQSAPAKSIAIQWLSPTATPWAACEARRLRDLLETRPDRRARLITLETPTGLRPWSATAELLVETLRDSLDAVWFDRVVPRAPTLAFFDHVQCYVRPGRVSMPPHIVDRVDGIVRCSESDHVDVEFPESRDEPTPVVAIPHAPLPRAVSEVDRDRCLFVDGLFGSESAQRDAVTLWTAIGAREVEARWLSHRGGGRSVLPSEPFSWPLLAQARCLCLLKEPSRSPVTLIAEAIARGVEILVPASVRDALPWELRSYCEEWSERREFDLARALMPRDDRERRTKDCELAFAELTERARRALDRLIDHNPHPVRIRELKRVAKAEFGERRWPEAIDRYSALADLEPRVASHYTRLGKCLRAVDQPALSLAAYAEAMRADPTDQRAASKHRELLTELNRPESDAAENLEQWIEEQPDGANRCALLGDYLRERGSKTRAIEQYRQLRKLDPQRGGVLETLSEMHWERGDLEETEEVCAALLEQKPKQYKGRIRYLLASCALRRDDGVLVERAREALRAVKASIKANGTGSAREPVVRWLARLATLVDARKAAERSPRDAGARFAYGDALQAALRIDEAVAAYCEARDLDSDILVKAVPLSGAVPFPNFLIIGAARSGTSWLKITLARHERIAIANGEPNYFEGRIQHEVEDYLREFDLQSVKFKGIGVVGDRSRRSHFLVGEKSPQYADIPGANIDFVQFLMPDVKLVHIVREPIERGWSHIKHAGLVGDAIEFFEGRREDPGPKLRAVLDAGRYDQQIERWQARFGEEALLVCDFDAIRDQPQAFVNEVTDHLGLDRLPLAEELLRDEKSRGATKVVTMPDVVRDGLAAYYDGMRWRP